MRKIEIYLLPVLLLLLLPGSISAQKDLDSIIGITKNKIFDDPNNAIQIGNEILSNATQARTKINALMLISNAYLSKRENSKSLEYALETQKYLPELRSKRTQINVLNTIGMQHQQLRIYDKAIEYLDEALLLSKQIKDPDSLPSILGYNYTIRGFIYREKMSCEIAQNYFNKAIYQFDKINNISSVTANLSILTYNKGNCFLQTSQIDSARINFQKSIDYAQKVGANSLFAFAKKGLSEVFTAEGNYLQAIEELKEAEDASDKVGDLVLNQGIYKNLSDNYLAIDKRELYKKYFKKYSDVEKKVHIKEQKSVNASITNLIQDNKDLMQEKLSDIKTLMWIVIIAIIVLIFTFSLITMNNYKRFRKAKEMLETLKP